ncbi:Inositol-pentakisphosphate 2-kinase [Haplosporangium sp. Z 767]|nr:Inositol-pentakisphosphate 2-kinase [Haplosporangium sp. Z 767]
MTTINELYHAEHWAYRAEGNANLVLRYIGPDPRFSTTVLRLRKVDRPICKLAGSNGCTDQLSSVAQQAVETKRKSKKNDLSMEIDFISNIIAPLLGKEFVEQRIAVALPTEFLLALAVAIEPSRPKNRLQKVIDCSQAVGFLSLDHTRFLQSSASQPSISLEIKPKWGFLTKSAFICKAHEIKKRKCRFCMYQHRKVKTGVQTKLSEYCPIDLFSGEEHLVQNAIDSLVKTPQNNLRLFVDGTQRTISTESLTQGLSGSSSQGFQRPGSLTGEKKSQQTPLSPQRPLLTDILTQILVKSPLLRRLGRLQQALDSLDIETIHRFYVQLADPVTITLPEPTLDEFLNTVEALLDRTDMDAMMDENQSTFEDHNVASLGFGPDDALDEIPNSLKLHFIREFLLSATLKDCSILITIQRSDEAGELSEKDTNIDLSKTARVHGNAETDVLVFNEVSHRIKVKGEYFWYKIACIDLDPKKMNSVPMYLKKDHDIVSYYLSTVGTFVYFAPGAAFVTSTLLPHLILVLGATISLVSFLGYYGVMNEKRWILWAHGMILLIAIALQITVGAIAFVYRNQGTEVLDKAWDRVYRSDPHVIQDLENFFQCCGFEHVLDRAVPATCFLDHRFMTGCRENIQTTFQDSLQAIGVIGAILGGIELVSLLGAVILFHRFDKQRYNRESVESEVAFVNALFEARQLEREIEEARRQRERERQVHLDSLTEQVRAQTLARAEEEGLIPSNRNGHRGRRESRRGGGRSSDDPPAYGTFDTNKPFDASHLSR